MNRAVHLFLSAAVALALAVVAATATEWPAKPVRVIVPVAAGGAADFIGRVFAASLAATLGQPFVVENRVGAGGLTGTESVARSEPDGYTLMVSGMSFHVLAPALSRNPGFHPVRDFTHIAYFGGTPMILVAHPSLGIKSFQELSALADGRNGAIDYVSPGTGTVGNIVAEVLANDAKLKLQHVPYKGGGAAILDLVAGHVKVGCMTLSTTLEHIRAGGLVPIAVSSPHRVSDLPQVPTFAELGYPDLVLTSWFALSGPANLPEAIVEPLNHAVNDSMTKDDVRSKLQKEAVLTKPMTPEEFTRFVESEVNKWTPVVNALMVTK